jgi:hypothetical protein
VASEVTRRSKKHVALILRQIVGAGFERKQVLNDWKGRAS